MSLFSSPTTPCGGIPTPQMGKRRQGGIKRFTSWHRTDLNVTSVLPSLRETHGVSGHGRTCTGDAEDGGLTGTGREGLRAQFCLGSGKSFHLPGPQWSHLWSGAVGGTHFAGVLSTP